MLVDFGLMAQFSGRGSRELLLVERGSVGTISYMAPEQIRGEIVDARTDFYALGCILYELITGSPPFRGKSDTKVINAHLSQNPPPPSHLRPDLPPELDDLVLRLLAKEPRHRLGYADTVAAILARYTNEDESTETDLKPQAYLYRSRFAGRDVQQAMLREFLDRLLHKRGGIIFVSGESGIGKTRLAMEFGKEAAAQDVLVLTGECPDRGASPLVAFRKPLHNLADRCLERGRHYTDLLFGARGKVLALCEPTLAGLPGQDVFPEPADLPPEAANVRLYWYMTETLKKLAKDTPVLIIVDDLQWADDLTLGFLEFVIRSDQFDASPVLLVGTYRSEDVVERLQKITRSFEVKNITLNRLNEDAISAVVSDMLALSPAPVALCFYLTRHSEGNPFFVAEYLHVIVEQGLLVRDETGSWHINKSSDRNGGVLTFESLSLPNSLQELINHRLQGLPEQARHVIKNAAIIGRETSFQLLLHMTGLDETKLFDMIEELRQRQVFEKAEPDIIRFAHDKIREVAFSRITIEEKRKLNQKAAESIEKVYAHNISEYLSVLGDHWEEADDYEKAKKYYLLGARQAKDSFAHSEAERLYRAFFRLISESTPTSIQAHNELGHDVYHLLGRNREAIEHHKKAITEAEFLKDTQAEARSKCLLGVVLAETGNSDDALKLYEQALMAVGEGGDTKLRGIILSNIAIIHAEQGRIHEARSFYNKALKMARDAGYREGEGLNLGHLAGLYRLEGHLDKARALYDQSLIITRQFHDPSKESWILGNLANVYSDQGQLDEAREFYNQALRIAREVGDRRFEAVTLGNLAILVRKQERLDKARQLYEEALTVFREVGDLRNQGWMLGNLANLHHEKNDIVKARDLYEQALEITREVTDRQYEGWLLGNLATLSIQEGRMDKVLELYEKALDIAREVGNKRSEALTLNNIALLCSEQGLVEKAREFYKQGLNVARDAGDHRSGSIALLGLAALNRRTSVNTSLVSDQLNQAYSIINKAENPPYLIVYFCEQGHCNLASKTSAQSFLKQARRIYHMLPDSTNISFKKAIERLAAAQNAFNNEEHQKLFRGELIVDIPEGLRDWLVHTDQLQRDRALLSNMNKEE